MNRSIKPLVVGLLLLSTHSGHAKWARVSEAVPVERLVENVSRYVKEHPDDAEGYYTLGRIHSLAFARGGDKVEVIPAGSTFKRNKPELPGFAGYDSIQVVRDKADEAPKDETLAHLQASVRAYAQACTMAPKNGLYLLGFGWMLEQGAPFAAKAGAAWDDPRKKQDAVKSADWLAKSLVAYRQAYTLTKENDAKGGGRGPVADSAISLEAGEGILRVLDATSKNNVADKAEIDGIRAHIAVINAKPRAVTPIIIPLGNDLSLRGMLARRQSTKFDLAGNGLGQRWPWVGPDAGILVWDPQRTGKITSGRQLFGSVTWWIFWKNGYDALAALDNDGNGRLTGRELDGIAIWRDENGNGVSDAGEVKPLREWGIGSIDTRGKLRNGVLSNPRGATRVDGMVLPTYDWTPRSLD